MANWLHQSQGQRIFSRFWMLFLLLEKLNEKVFVQVVWKYRKDDDDMMSSGLRFSKLLNLEFELRTED